MTVTGKTVGENLKERNAHILDTDVIHTIDNAYSKEGGIAILRGSLAPDGAVVKQSAVAPEMMRREVTARVFESEEDAMHAILDGKIKPGVRRGGGRYEGPNGRPRHAARCCPPPPPSPAWAWARTWPCSPTAASPAVPTVRPSATSRLKPPMVAPSPWCVTADRILVDIPNRKLDLLVDEAELARRRAELVPPQKECPYPVPAPLRQHGELRRQRRHVQESLGRFPGRDRRPREGRCRAVIPCEAAPVPSGHPSGSSGPCVMPGTPEDARSFADGPALPPMQCGTIVSRQGLFLPHRCVMVFFHALQGILSLQIIVTVAYVLARKGWFSPETQILLPRLVTTVALPSYLFYTITHSFGRDDLVHLLYGSLFPLLSILLTFGVAWLIATIARVERRHFRPVLRQLLHVQYGLHRPARQSGPVRGCGPRLMCCCISLPIPVFSGASAVTSSATTTKSCAVPPRCWTMCATSFRRPCWVSWPDWP